MFNLNAKLIQWKFMQLLQKLIQSKNGIIFGGYVRDKIIHDHYATEYYKKCSSTNKDIKYNNPNYLPETKLRMIIPHDIDCFMTTQNFKEFKDLLPENMISYNESISTNLYIPTLHNQNLKHSKLKITFMMNPLMKTFINVCDYAIFVDVIYSDSIIEPPFGIIDFECNALLLTQSNDYKISDVLINILNLSDPMKKLTKLNQIITDILEMKATIATATIANYRITHMLNKKWTLISPNILLTVSNNHKLDDDICYICLDNICKSKYKCKFNCCKAYIHEYCMDTLIQSTKCETCPWCKKNKIINMSDIKLINSIN
jgi:hypothetical protein